MNIVIKCKIDKKGGNSFYVSCSGKEYYLFSQSYHKGVNSFFSGGKSIQNVFNNRSAKKDHYIIKTIEKMKPYIKYVEKENNIKILNSSIEKDVINKRRIYKRQLKNMYSY